jgi:hypothetical protein
MKFMFSFLYDDENKRTVGVRDVYCGSTIRKKHTTCIRNTVYITYKPPTKNVTSHGAKFGGSWPINLIQLICMQKTVFK